MTSEADRTFSFACFPAERIIILAGVLAGPAVAVALLHHYRDLLETARINPGLTLSSEAMSKALPGLTLLGALFLVAFGIFYLQYRAGTTLVVSDSGFRYVRKRLLPFGWLARSVELKWTAIVTFDFRQRLSFSGRRPELVLEWSGGRLVLSVSDAWEEGKQKRPWLPKMPDNTRGWRAHPLVETVTSKINRD